MGNPHTGSRDIGPPRESVEPAEIPETPQNGYTDQENQGTEAAGQDANGGSDWRTGYRDVIAVGEFRALWLAHALSMVGNYLLNLAVSVLVFQQTESALAAGFTLGLTFLPHVIGGPLLSGLADLFPRRRVILISDVVRAVLVAMISIPGLPLWLTWILLFCSILPMVPFSAARAALMSEIVQGERYVAGSAIINLTSHVGTLVGLVVGGAIVTLLDAHTTVLCNALTYVASAIIIFVGVRARPAPIQESTSEGSGRLRLWEVTAGGARLVFGDPRLRTLGLFAWLAGFYMVPYGLANPLAAQLDRGAAAAGLIMAGPAMGAVLGGFVLTRLISPAPRMRLIGPLAIAASLPLLGWLAQPPLWVMVALLVVSGACASYQFVANATFVLCVPPDGRGLAFGLVAAGLQAAQGVGIVLAGLLAEVVSLNIVITIAALCGTLGAVALTLPWSRLYHGTIELMYASEGAP
ncbi:MFS transporter [Salinactinospora qingdaonensis]|uniref:MFS transporter n=1 Tax=Salinactinospora qingdaonensis TaxID=702744 RepID=A0ABP7GE42_9ACTN